MANLLDMTMLVTFMRMSSEEHWQPKVFGESVRPMLETSRQAETNLWLLLAQQLKAPQPTHVRSAIAEWRRQHPQPEEVLAPRAVGFATLAAQDNSVGRDLRMCS